jgi:predicted acylesterase/phospholipase RssA
VTVLAVWVVCPAAGATRDPRTLVVLTAFTMVGVLLFLACVFYDLWHRWPSRRFSAGAFVANLLAYLLPVYLGVSFVLSAHGFWLAALAAVGAAGALAALGAALPGPAGEWVGGVMLARARRALLATRAARAVRRTRAAAEPLAPTGTAAGFGPARPTDPLQVWPFLVAVGVLFFLPFNLPFAPFDRVGSPAPVVCAALFAVVLAYGVVTVVVRRAVPVAVTALAFLAVMAGIEPYKYRYAAGVPGMDYANPLDLRAAAERDHARQQAFDAAVPEYRAAREAHARALAEWVANDTRRTDFALDLLNLGAVVRAVAAADAPRLARTLEDAEVRFVGERERLVELWKDMERNNRVIPARNGNRADVDFLTRPATGPGSYLSQSGDWPAVADPEQRAPLVVLAVSGGGLRSAAWTFTVLRTLEEQFARDGIDFPAHVRIITGASGGMFGAGYYVATLEKKREQFLARAVATRDTTELEACNDELYRKLTHDHLTPIVQQQVFEDVPNLFSPWPARNDRGKELERSWSKHLDGALDVPFADLRAAERAGRVPALVFTPMMVEDGRRLVVSNLDMRNALTNDGNLLLEKSSADPTGLECHSRDALELFRLFPDAPGGFRLSTAVRMSASFPFFSPAVSLPVAPRRRVVDAGYYDNYGVSLAAAWLMSGNNRPWLLATHSKVLLIQVRDGVDQPQRKLRRIDRDGSTRVTRALEELSSPVEGLYNARVGSSSFRNDGQLEILTHYFNILSNEPNLYRDPAHRLFQVVNFEFHERAALSWYLSEAEREKVKRAMTKSVREFDIDYNARMELIRNWWASKSRFEAQVPPP